MNSMKYQIMLYLALVLLTSTLAFSTSKSYIINKPSRSKMILAATGFNLDFFRSRFSKTSKTSIQTTHNYNLISDISRKPNFRKNRSMQEVNCHLPPRWHYKCVDGKKFEVVYL